MRPPIPQIPMSLGRRGSLAASRRSYIRKNTALFGPRNVLPASETIAGQLSNTEETTPKSSVVVIGEAPNGFGKQILWHPADAGLAVVAFLNAGDYLGVMISGVRATDTIEFVSSTGIASFSEETENKNVGAFIGIVAAGATVGAASFGAPELAPVIAAAEKFAKSRFEEQKVKTKRRDPFGVEIGTAHKARQEGGVIVSLPEARQLYHSGDNDHEDLWIKKPGKRDTAHHPDHVKKAFFLQPNMSNRRTAGADGDFIIAPWDHIFTDNFGYYRLHIVLKRGSGTLPEVE
jgi:hypothetical protein